MRLIQLGVTLSDSEGNFPEPTSTWQFNFLFDLDQDKSSKASIQLLQSCGIEFTKLKYHGISPQFFAEKVTQSGLVLNDKIHWICFHGCYDFAYFMKVMTNEMIPTNREHFYRLMKIFFPQVYDLKSFQHELSPHIDTYFGLNRLADILGLERVGTTH